VRILHSYLENNIYVHVVAACVESPCGNNFICETLSGVHMQCSKCGSDHTQRLQVAYDGGTQDISATSHTAGVGSISGSLGLGGSVTKTSGVSRSVLAQKAAPPEKRKLMAVLVVTFIGFLCLQGTIGVMLFGLALMAFGGYGLYNSIKFNSKHWPGLYQRWLESWMCHKCGHTYHHA
jgi:hypothetical protein